MPKYIVQVRPRVVEGVASGWEDVSPPYARDNRAGTWDASSPQEAFHLAITTGDYSFALDEAKPLREGAYRVLPFGGGATFQVGLNIDETVHESQREVVAHGR